MKDANKINVMILIVSMPVGGVENLVLPATLMLDKEKYSVTICCIKELGSLGMKAKEMGIHTIELNLMKSNRFSPAIAYRLRQLLKKHNIHVLWTHQYVANLYGRIAAFMAGTPVVVPTFHVLYGNPKFHRRLFNHVLAHRKDVMVSVSNAVASDIIRYDGADPRKIRIIPSGVDLNKFDSPVTKQDARKAFGLPLDGTIIGSVGRIVEQKGHRYLIEAAAGLEDICVVIAGDGPLLDELKTLAARLNARCFFPGGLEIGQIPVFLRAINIFCFPSLWEGLGLALIEAMAAGLPAVATDIPPHREVLEDAGLYFAPGNAEELAGTLEMLINNAALRESLASKAKERAKAFSIENTLKAYEDIFEYLLQRKGLL